jgi:hypothetical protein
MRLYLNDEGVGAHVREKEARVDPVEPLARRITTKDIRS